MRERARTDVPGRNCRYPVRGRETGSFQAIKARANVAYRMHRVAGTGPIALRFVYGAPVVFVEEIPCLKLGLCLPAN
jgi:hypothetical protein